MRRHSDVIDRGEPWDVWGDEDCRYLVVDDVLHAVDVSGRGRFAALTKAAGTVTGVASMDGVAMVFDQDDRGVSLDRPPRRQTRLPVVYRIDRDPPAEAPIELFSTPRPASIELAPLLVEARRGSIVQLGDGVYLGPARIPDGVTVRGLGPDRTTIDGIESMAVALGDSSRLEHCRVVGGGERIVWLPNPIVSIPGDRATLLGCRVDGHVDVAGDDVRITSCRMAGVVASGAERADICRSTFVGMQWDCALDVKGGSGHVVEGCEFRDVLQAIRINGAIGAQIRGNRIDARWWGVHLVDTEGSSVVGNSIVHTMRAVDIDGGTLAEITGNAVSDGDSGCLVQRGATDVEITGNHWERCRIGVMAWDSGTVRHYGNTVVDLLDAGSAVVTGP